MKKLSLNLILIATALFLCTQTVQAGQNSTATVHIDVDTLVAGIQTDRTADVGEVFDVDIVINGAVNLKIFNLVVTFPQNILGIQEAGVTKGDLFPNLDIFKREFRTGKVEITGGVMENDDAVSGNGVLFHLRFEVLSRGQANLQFLATDTQTLQDNTGTGPGSVDDPVALGNAYGATVYPPEAEATKLAFTTSPSTSPAGANLSPTPVVTVQDAQGNTVTSSTASITIAIKTGTGTAGATLSGTKTVSAVDGVATFSVLKINKMGSNYQLTATSTGLTSADSGAFDVISSTPIRLAFTTSPGETPAMAVLSPHPQVAIQDAYGNTVTSSTAPITVTSNKGTLSGTTTVNAVNGVAKFQDLKIRPAGTGYQLNASSPGLTSTDSQAFNITAEPALTIEKSDGADPVDPNTEVTYTITYGNSGLAAAHITVIIETLPANLTYVSSTGDGVYEEAARAITWTIGTLNAETTGKTVTFTARVASTMLEGGKITNSVLTIDCDETEPVGQITPETTTVNDKKAPATSGYIPESDSIQVARDTIIQLHITDGGSGVKYDGGTVKIYVEDDLIYDGSNETSDGVYDSTGKDQAVKGICRRVGTEADYMFVFQSSTQFDYEQQVDVEVSAEDEAGNILPGKTYHFHTVMRSFGKNVKVNSDNGTLVQNRPATARDSAGNIWVVWDQTTAAGDTDIYIAELLADGSAFEPNVPVVIGANDQRNPAVAIDSSDRIYVTWEERNPSDPNSKWNIFIAPSTNGIDWTPPVQIDPCDAVQVSPAITIDGTGKAYIAWEDNRTGDKNIWVATSTDGAAWASTPVTTDESSQSEPAIAIDEFGTAYIVWTDARNAGTTGTDIYGADSLSGNWENEEIVKTSFNQWSPAIATESSGTVLHLLWVDDTDPNESIFYRATTDGLQGPLEVDLNVVDEPNYVQSAPAIAVRGSGETTKVFACWQDARWINKGDVADIYFTESGSGFDDRTNVLVNDDGVDENTQTAPDIGDIGVDKYGNPYIVWVDDRNGNNDIYYADPITIGDPLTTIVEVNDVDAFTLVEATTPDDLKVTVKIPDQPLGVLPSELTIREIDVDDLPQLPPGSFGVPYDLGPSGLVFSPPVTITIQHNANVSHLPICRAYWYDAELGWQPTGGIPANHVVISPTLHAVTFETTHFTLFGVSASSAPSGGGGGGGGCAMSAHGQGNVAEFLLPYIGFVVVLLVITWVDARRRRTKCNS